MRILRWCLVLPATLAAWYAVFIAGMLFHSQLEPLLCPPAEMVSGACGNLGVIRTLRAVIVLFAALSAVAVVLAATVTAPARKLLVAWGTFAIGSEIAILMAIEVQSPLEGAAAVAAGLLTALWLTRRSRRSARSGSRSWPGGSRPACS